MRSFLHINFLLILLFCAPLSAQPKVMFQLHPPAKAPFPIVLDATQKARLDEALQSRHAAYDAAEHMLKKPFTSPGYHTTLKSGMVHPTRDAAAYAAAILDTGNSEMKRRAEDVLCKIVSLQDTDPNSKTYGIWSWFYEEPLSQMAPPDWNWADFIGVQLLQVALSHRDEISPDLMAQIDEAIGHACRAIIKRDVQPSYTNIAIMGTYVTLVAGEHYDCAEFRDYGLARLKKFHAYTLHHGAFTEYNSPTYTIVALEEIGRLRSHVQTLEAKPLVEDIYRVAWEEIAQHFHAPTRQWAGPHSRCYSTLLRGNILAQIERSTEGRVKFGEKTAPSLTEHRLPLPCPRDLEHYFVKLDEPRELVKTFVRDEKPVVGTTYLAPDYCLGTINRGDLWNQRRSLVAYWGDAKAPSYLHLRFLHDGYDFAAAQFFSVQRQGAALCAVNFATDGGDTHVSLDRIQNATFKAKDLRLRFEFGGAAGKSAPRVPAKSNSSAHLLFGDVHLQIAVPWARFEQYAGYWEAGQKDDVAWLDLVLYSGEEQVFNLAKIHRAALAAAVQFSMGDAPFSLPEEHLMDGRLNVIWNQMGIEIPIKPARVGEL